MEMWMMTPMMAMARGDKNTPCGIWCFACWRNAIAAQLANLIKSKASTWASINIVVWCLLSSFYCCCQFVYHPAKEPVKELLDLHHHHEFIMVVSVISCHHLGITVSRKTLPHGMLDVAGTTPIRNVCNLGVFVWIVAFHQVMSFCCWLPVVQCHVVTCQLIFSLHW